MSNIEENIKHVNAKLQQLLKNYAALQKENSSLKNQLSDLKQKETNYTGVIDEMNQKLSILKAASGQMTEADQKEFEKRIDQYIKEIDKCIGILSE